jgi:hypothetical protein
MIQLKNKFRPILLLAIIIILQLTVLISPVAAAPTITSAILPTGQIGVVYSATLTATGVTGAAAWALSSGTIPTGLTLGATTGIISGTPTATGTFTFYVICTDSTGPSAPQYFYITINQIPLAISTTDLPGGKEGATYATTTLTATGGTTPYTWTVTSGSLPSGLTLSAGVLSGTLARNTYGTYSITIKVTDSSPIVQSASGSYSIFIDRGTYSPTVIIGSGLQSATTRVYIDGAIVASLRGGESKILSLGLGTTKSVTVDQSVADPGNTAIRYKARQESQTISESVSSVTFDYDTEYYIAFKTVPAINNDPQGSGWYKKSNTLNTSAVKESPGNAGLLYRFSYWLLPNNNKSTGEALNYTVEAPGTITAYYDAYYKLTIDSAYGDVQGGGYYLAGSQATWKLPNDRVPMQDIMGFFQGKYKASASSGTVTMDGPKTVTILWEPDYTMPGILIPLAIIGVVLAGVGIYIMMKRQQQPRVVPMATIIPGGSPMMGYPPQTMMPPPIPPPQPAPRPIPQQHTTVVMIENKGEQQKQLPGSTKEQLVDSFRQLLDKYETDIKGTIGSAAAASLGAGPVEAPRVEAPKGKMLEAPEFVPPAVPPQSAANMSVEPEYVKEIKEPCGNSAKKLLRTVVTKWHQEESSTVTIPSSDPSKEPEIGLEVIWARDMYHEWDIVKCTLPVNHSGSHKGDSRIAYSLLNTVTIKSTFGSTQKVEPPSPHFTESMPEVELSDDQIVHAGDLPAETIK